MQITNFLLPFIFGGFLVEAIIKLVRAVRQDWRANQWLLWSAITGTLVSAVFGINFPAVAGVPVVLVGFGGMLATWISTGIVIGRGANGAHDALEWIRGNSQQAQADAINSKAIAVMQTAAAQVSAPTLSEISGLNADVAHEAASAPTSTSGEGLGSELRVFGSEQPKQ